MGAPTVQDVSGNTNSRLFARRGLRPVGIVVHTSSGVSSLHYLQGGVLAEGRAASADALIDRDGTINVIVPFDCYSYHAGVANYVQPTGIAITNINELFLGVELEALPNQSCTSEQYVSLAGYVLNKARAYHWSLPYCILGHYEVAVPMGRRSDPLNFDWGHFYWRLNTETSSDWWKGN